MVAKEARPRTRIDRALLRPLLRYGSSALLVGLSSTLTLLILRSALVSKLGLAPNGIYQVCVGISGLYMPLILNSITAIVWPQIAGHALYAAQQVEEQVPLHAGHRQRNRDDLHAAEAVDEQGDQHREERRRRDRGSDLRDQREPPHLARMIAGPQRDREDPRQRQHVGGGDAQEREQERERK